MLQEKKLQNMLKKKKLQNMLFGKLQKYTVWELYKIKHRKIKKYYRLKKKIFKVKFINFYFFF